MEEGNLSEERIDTSAARILRVKLSMELNIEARKRLPAAQADDCRQKGMYEYER